jgi:hypothetical protein
MILLKLILLSVDKYSYIFSEKIIANLSTGYKINALSIDTITVIAKYKTINFVSFGSYFFVIKKLVNEQITVIWITYNGKEIFPKKTEILFDNIFCVIGLRITNKTINIATRLIFKSRANSL